MICHHCREPHEVLLFGRYCLSCYRHADLDHLALSSRLYHEHERQRYAVAVEPTAIRHADPQPRR